MYYLILHNHLISAVSHNQSATTSGKGCQSNLFLPYLHHHTTHATTTLLPLPPRSHMIKLAHLSCTADYNPPPSLPLRLPLTAVSSSVSTQKGDSLTKTILNQGRVISPPNWSTPAAATQAHRAYVKTSKLLHCCQPFLFLLLFLAECIAILRCWYAEQLALMQCSCCQHSMPLTCSW